MATCTGIIPHSSLGRPLTAGEAFIYFYGGLVLFYKTGTTNGTAYGMYSYIGHPVNRVGIKVYTVADIDSPDTGYRWATHEMGHYMAPWIALVINRERQKTR